MAAVSSAHCHSSGKLLRLFSSMDYQGRLLGGLLLPAAAPEPAGTATDREQANRPKPSREVQVTGTAEVRCPADRASLRVSVGSTKESVNEASNSVSRRVEYILQAVRQNGVGDKDASVRRFLHREGEQYHMDAEVTVTFSDFEKMERVRSVLLEKLDKSVDIGAPRFHHSAECLSQMRHRACVSAVENARQKASEISRLLGQTLGSPLLVREEETREWKNEEDEDGGRDSGGITYSQLPCAPVITVSSRVSASFSLSGRAKNKLN